MHLLGEYTDHVIVLSMINEKPASLNRTKAVLDWSVLMLIARCLMQLGL